MAQLCALPEGQTRPVSLRCSEDGILLVKLADHLFTSITNGANLNEVPEQAPLPLQIREAPGSAAGPILGVRADGQLQAIAVDDSGKLLLAQEEHSKRSKHVQFQQPPPYHSLQTAGEARTVVIKAGAVEAATLIVGPVVFTHFSLRNNMRANVIVKIRLKDTTDGGAPMSAAVADRELAAGESWDFPFIAGLGVRGLLEASASSADPSAPNAKNGVSFSIAFVRL